MNRGQLRWRASRHALLELDIVFQRFLASRFDALSDDEAAVLEELLLEEDHDLWEMVSGRRECAEPRWADLIAMLRQCSLEQADARKQ